MTMAARAGWVDASESMTAVLAATPEAAAALRAALSDLRRVRRAASAVILAARTAQLNVATASRE
jgi:hypothetical protein